MNYDKLLQAILDVAEEMLVCGAEVSRVEDSIIRMCTAYDCGRVNAFIITTNIQVTMENPSGKIITQIRSIVRNDTNFDRLDYLNDLSRFICETKPDLDRLKEKFDEVMNRKPLPKWLEYIGAALGASGFTVFFSGSPMDCLAVALLALGVTFLTRVLAGFEENQIARLFVTSLAAGFGSVLLVKIGIGEHVDKLMIGSIMLLIPGVAMTNSLRDMLIGDIATGTLRFINSLIMAMAIACGFALALLAAGGGA